MNDKIVSLTVVIDILMVTYKSSIGCGYVQDSFESYQAFIDQYFS